jgi:hypothetical protein
MLLILMTAWLRGLFKPRLLGFTLIAGGSVCAAAAQTHERAEPRSQDPIDNAHRHGRTGQWGFAALVVADGHRILFDTGARPDTVLNNVRELLASGGLVRRA